jgi:hypothetical protein|tara:strand:+ start:1208 stop:1360 length:153 start_codon:yes stop_codon:yes gene_type:complete
MKLISPNGKGSIDAHPTKAEYLKEKGWKEEAAQIKSSSKQKNEVIKDGNS